MAQFNSRAGQVADNRLSSSSRPTLLFASHCRPLLLLLLLSRPRSWLGATTCCPRTGAANCPPSPRAKFANLLAGAASAAACASADAAAAARVPQAPQTQGRRWSWRPPFPALALVKVTLGRRRFEWTFWPAPSPVCARARATKEQRREETPTEKGRRGKATES